MALQGRPVHRRIGGRRGGALMASAKIFFDVYDAELQLADILRAFDTSEEGLAAAPDREAKYIDAVLSDHPDAERNEIRRHLVNEAFSEIERSRQTICQAFVLSNFSTFEFGLLRITENYLTAANSNFVLKDFAGHGYEKFLIVANKLAAANLINKESWDCVPSYCLVRNQIAHNGGMCTNIEERNKIEKALKTLGNSGLNEVPEQDMWSIEIEPRFVKKMNARMTVLLRSAHETLEGILDHANP